MKPPAKKPDASTSTKADWLMIGWLFAGAVVIAMGVLAVLHDEKLASQQQQLDGMQRHFQRQIDALQEHDRRVTEGLTK